MTRSEKDSPKDIFAVVSELQAQLEATIATNGAGDSPESVASGEVAPSSANALKKWLSQSLGSLRNATAKPQVSIVIPVYNKAAYTMRCLESLSRQNSEYTFEVIVVDNASADETPQLVAGVPGVRYIRNKTNQGFVDGCNGGVKQARGDIVVLLNNDTNVLGGWLDALVNRLISDPSIGMVGSKLIYPDGSLQEAGGIIYSDATGHNYGKHARADSFEYNFVRDVDYCSGASVAFFRKDFEQLGGFDKRYAPAFYEDSDLAMEMRHTLKKRVVYEPHSIVMHVEGGTAGTDIGSGFKRYQAINQKKFLQKWRKELKKYHYPPGTNPHVAARHGRKKRVLVVDGIVPEHNRDSGSLRMTQILKAAQKLDYDVTLYPDNRVATLPYTAEFQSAGVEVVYGETTPRDFHKNRLNSYDIVLLSRPLSAFWHLAYSKSYQTTAKVIYDTVDLHFLRISRQAELEKSSALEHQAKLWQQLEYYLMDQTNSTLVVSYEEQKYLQKHKPDTSVTVVSNINPSRSSNAPDMSYEARSGLLFIGSYNHVPNRDAVSWLAEKLYPKIEQKIPDVHLQLLGTNPTPEVLALASKNITVPGFIEDVEPHFGSARVFICPLRYGAGVKGKVSQALACGLPIVSTSIGVEGMQLRDGYDCLIADTPAEFIDKVTKLYSDKKLWETIRKNALQTYQKTFSEAAGLEALKHAFQD